MKPHCWDCAVTAAETKQLRDFYSWSSRSSYKWMQAVKFADTTGDQSISV